MSRFSIKSPVFVAIALVLFLPVNALPAQPAAPACAEANISLSPSTVARGATLTVAASITNCSTDRQFYILRYDLSTPCTRQLMAYLIVPFDAGQTRALSIPFTVPSFACLGEYTVTLTVFSLRGVALDSSTASVVVQ